MLLYFGNPDHYVSGRLSTNFHGSGELFGSGGVPIVRADGYLGRPALSSSVGLSFVKIYARSPAIHPLSLNSFRCGGRFLFEQYPATPEPFLAAVNQAGEIQVCACLKPDGTVGIYLGAVAEEIRSSNTVLALDTFYRLGFKGDIDRTNGNAAIQLNRTIICQAAAKNTMASDIAGWAGVAYCLQEDCAVNHYYFGDSYGHQPDLIPSLFVKYTRPLIVTDLAECRASADTYPECIDDPTPDEDASYLDLYNDGDGYLAGLSTLDPTTLIYAAQISARVKNTADYGPAFRHLIATNGVLREGEVDYPMELDYQVVRHVYYQAWDDGFGFTTDKANTSSIGGRLIGS